MTKAAEQQAEIDRLRAENERLRNGQGAPNVPAELPYLSEGERQDLITYGISTTRTGQRINLHDARERWPDADLTAASEGAERAADKDRDARALERPATRGVDFVYPSVAPGVLDPAAAGRPGISGPVADADHPAVKRTDPAVPGDQLP